MQQVTKQSERETSLPVAEEQKVATRNPLKTTQLSPWPHPYILFSSSSSPPPD
jgi:hypothetical protein